MYHFINHTLQFEFSRPIFIEPLTVRLRPRCDATQRLAQFAFDIRTPAAGMTDVIDVDGNAAKVVWFDRLHDSPEIMTTSVVETLRANPFDFIFTDEAAMRLPMRYEPALEMTLAAYRQPLRGDGPIARFARHLLARTENETMFFLWELAETFYKEFKIAAGGYDAQDAETTFARRGGSSRELARLFMEVCRCVGLAARFVSGYRGGPDSMDPPNPHAWAEVYLPGGGWRGYDPSSGLVVADEHIAVAAGPEPLDAVPASHACALPQNGASVRYKVEIVSAPSHDGVLDRALARARPDAEELG